MKEFAVQISEDGGQTWHTEEFCSFLDDRTIVRHGAFKNRTAAECAENLLGRKRDELAESKRTGVKVTTEEGLKLAAAWLAKANATSYRMAVREVTEWVEWEWRM